MAVLVQDLAGFPLAPFSPKVPNDGSVSEEVPCQCWGEVVGGSKF